MFEIHIRGNRYIVIAPSVKQAISKLRKHMTDIGIPKSFQLVDFAGHVTSKIIDAGPVPTTRIIPTKKSESVRAYTEYNDAILYTNRRS